MSIFWFIRSIVDTLNTTAVEKGGKEESLRLTRTAEGVMNRLGRPILNGLLIESSIRSSFPTAHTHTHTHSHVQRYVERKRESFLCQRKLIW